jgi:phage baseplate assembly protein gpV
MANTLTNLIGDLAWRISEIERRAANKKRTGTIAEVGTGDNAGKYRVQFSAQNGKPFLSPWMKSRTIGAGGVKFDIVRTVGEQVEVLSESGDLTDGVIDLSVYSNENARANSADVPLHIQIGDAVLEMSGDGLTITAGTIKLKGDVTIEGDVSIAGSSLTHNSKNVGSTHIHPESIGVVTGAPQ